MKKLKALKVKLHLGLVKARTLLKEHTLGTALRRRLQTTDPPGPAPEDTVEAASLSLGKDSRIPELIYFRLRKILEHLPGVSNKLTEHKCSMSLLSLKCLSLGEISSVKYTL